MEVVRRARHRLGHHHQPAAVQQCAPDLPHRDVEHQECHCDHTCPGPRRRSTRPSTPAVGHIVMRDGHTLGHTGRPRGVDHVGDVLRGGVRRPRFEAGSTARSSTSMTATSEPSSRARSSAVVTATTGPASASMNSIRASARRVDRQIRRPGLQYRQHRHDRLGRPRNQQRHRSPGPAPGRPTSSPTGSRPHPVRGRSPSDPRTSTLPPRACGPPARRTPQGSTSPPTAGCVSTAWLPRSSNRSCSSRRADPPTTTAVSGRRS